MTTRSACVISGKSPDEVRPLVGARIDVTLTANRHGTLVTGKPRDLPIDAAADLGTTVYDIMYSPVTGWFAVTIFRGESTPSRWDNRPGEDAGYPRIGDILGATTPMAILDALDVPADAVGYALS